VLACQGKGEWTVIDGGASKSEAEPLSLEDSCCWD
jgi:hypothetical protein